MLDVGHDRFDMSRHDFIQVFVLFVVDDERSTETEVANARVLLCLFDVDVRDNAVVHFDRAIDVFRASSTRTNDDFSDVRGIESFHGFCPTDVLEVGVIDVTRHEGSLLHILLRLLLLQSHLARLLHHAVVTVCFRVMQVLLPLERLIGMQRRRTARELDGKVVHVDAVRLDARRDDLTEGDFFFDAAEALIVAHVVLFDVTSEATVECTDGACASAITRTFNLLHRTLDEFTRAQRVHGFSGK